MHNIPNLSSQSKCMKNAGLVYTDKFYPQEKALKNIGGVEDVAATEGVGGFKTLHVLNTKVILNVSPVCKT